MIKHQTCFESFKRKVDR